jgi:hypothetical protein
MTTKCRESRLWVWHNRIVNLSDLENKRLILIKTKIININIFMLLSIDYLGEIGNEEINSFNLYLDYH